MNNISCLHQNSRPNKNVALDVFEVENYLGKFKRSIAMKNLKNINYHCKVIRNQLNNK
jgi:hypothetical protein